MVIFVIRLLIFPEKYCKNKDLKKYVHIELLPGYGNSTKKKKDIQKQSYHMLIIKMKNNNIKKYH